MWPEIAVAAAPAWPAAAALIIAALLLRRSPPSERTVVGVATASLALSFVSVVIAAAHWVLTGFRPLALSLGHWFRVGDYELEVFFLVDGASVPVALTAAVLVLLTSRFSANYLHREPGFTRFFLLVLCFASGLFLLVLGGGLDVLFAGWEVVGLCSVLLVAFFHERPGPVRAAIRVLVTYRLCDVGLVAAAVLIHRAHHSSAFTLPAGVHAAPGGATAAAVGVAFVVAAIGKSAQFPVGGWLPRAMEGPTASSAVFYGGLSVHAGVFLLIRAAPWLDAAPSARVLVIIIGATTAIMSTLSAQVASDAKTGLAYATIAQVGLMFIECGLGLYQVATIHLCAHAILRYYQFLRTPSVLQDQLERRAALGATLADESAARWELLGIERRRFVYRLAIERFEVEAALDRWLVRPLMTVSSALDAVERRVMERRRPASPPRTPPAHRPTAARTSSSAPVSTDGQKVSS